jgi:hypothetical protein
VRGEKNVKRKKMRSWDAYGRWRLGSSRLEAEVTGLESKNQK